MKTYFLIVHCLILIFSTVKVYSDIGHDFFANLPDNSWTQVPTHNNPKREGHAGITIDNEGGKLYIFGSDTHGDQTPDNAMHILDLSTLEWTDSYDRDPLSRYLIDDDGWTMTTTGRPWAAHIFYNMVFLSDLNAIFVHTKPIHNYPAHALINIKPTDIAEQSWLYFIDDNQWMPLKDSLPPPLWAEGLSYNPILDRIIGQRGNETYLFNSQSLLWETVSSTGSHSSTLESSAGFNPISEKSFRFAGNFPVSTQITEYDSVDKTWTPLETVGTVPDISRGGQPMTVDTINNVLIYHAKDEDSTLGSANTWVFNLTTHVWEEVTPTIHPPNFGFNFMMTFYEKENVALYYVKVPEEGRPEWSGEPELWAYRYKSANNGDKNPPAVLTPPLSLLLF